MSVVTGAGDAEPRTRVGFGTAHCRNGFELCFTKAVIYTRDACVFVRLLSRWKGRQATKTARRWVFIMS